MRQCKGNILVMTLVFSAMALSMVVTSISGFGFMENRAAKQKHGSEMAFQIAEAGIEYYKWHLAHDETDYQDGTGAAGPYVHDYYDKDGNKIGEYSLSITPPPAGSSIVTVESTGYTVAYPETKRKLKARIGFPSLTDYAFLTNSDVWIGDNEAIHGKLHANGGIRFDGTTDSIISSAKETYTCKTYHGCNNQTKDGIWGDGTPEDFWQFPVPAFDFNGITVDLADVKTGAQSAGVYLSSSGYKGWHLKFKSNGTFDAYKVKTLYSIPSPGYGKDVNGVKHYESYDIKTETFYKNYTIPTNGLIFVEDLTWVDGTVHGKVTVGSGKFPVSPATYTSIVIPNNIIYTAKDGTDVLGLMAQNHVLIPRKSPNILEIDAAVIAQNGSAQRFYYPGNILDSLTIYGSVVSNGVWTWSWVTQGGSIVSGYKNTNTTYDANLTFGPPPSFPVGNGYQLISWEEVK
ncbi:MAG: pilus assembly PilX N-terminal domain-containing protein [Patescibacteria group bacterium]